MSKKGYEPRHYDAFGELKSASDWSLDPRCLISLGTLRTRLYKAKHPQNIESILLEKTNSHYPDYNIGETYGNITLLKVYSNGKKNIALAKCLFCQKTFECPARDITCGRQKVVDANTINYL